MPYDLPPDATYYNITIQADIKSGSIHRTGPYTSTPQWGAVRNGPVLDDGIDGIYTAVDSENAVGWKVLSGVATIYRYVAVFDTSVLPANAVVTGAVMTPFNPMSLMYEGDKAQAYTFTPSSPTTITRLDFTSFGSTRISVATLFTTYPWQFSPMYLNRTGYTYIGLRDEHHDVDSIAPSTANYTHLHFVNPASPPTLYIEYFLGTSLVPVNKGQIIFFNDL